MGLGKVFKKGLPGSPASIVAGTSAGKNLLTGGAYGNTKDINAAQGYLSGLGQQGLEQRLANLNTMQAPVTSDATKARINALKQEAVAVPLSQNASFQGDRANLVQNARQEVGGIQNAQRAQGVTGGFSNTGSIQDAYDRLSGQLSGLGQKAKERQLEAGKEAADLEQEQIDRQLEFQNQQALLRDAIYKGDLEAASSIYQRLLELKNSSRSSGYQNTGKILGSGIVAGAKGAQGVA